jgi:hypothetical protein
LKSKIQGSLVRKNLSSREKKKMKRVLAFSGAATVVLFAIAASAQSKLT